MANTADVVAGNVATLAGLATFTSIVVVATLARRPAPRPVTADDAEHGPDEGAGRRPHRRRRRRRSVTGVATVTALAAGAIVVGVVPVGVLTASGVAVVARRRRRRDAMARQAAEAALPDAIEMLVLCVHAGRSPTQAVIELARRAPLPLRAGFAAVELHLHRGHRLGDALGELPRLIGPPARELASAVAMADREGLPLAPVLDRLAAEARAARRRLGEAAARRLPVRLSFPLVVCTLPAFVLLAIAPAVLGALSTLRDTAP